jgi:hypothetical protein
MWNVRNNEISMTERKSAASFGLDTPTIIKQSSCPGGITVVFDNHLQMKRKEEIAKIRFTYIKMQSISIDHLQREGKFE